MTLLPYLTFVLRTPLLRIGRTDSIDTRCIFLLLFRIATKHDVTYIIKGIPLYFLLRMPFFSFFLTYSPYRNGNHTLLVDVFILEIQISFRHIRISNSSSILEFELCKRTADYSVARICIFFLPLKQFI